MSIFMKFLTLVLAFSFCAKTFAGGMTSSGADQKSMSHGAAWFLGDASVDYCIEIATGQSVNESQVDQAFKFAIETWENYVSENTRFPLRDERPSFDFRKTNCSEATPLKIYVGVTNSEIEKAKEFFEKPYAMAHRISYDMKTRRGKGFIWFAPDAKTNGGWPQWNLPYNLQGMMLHEFGHIIGCEHAPGTIMEEDLMAKLQIATSDDKDWAEYGKYYMSHIDHHQFLHSHTDKPFLLKGEINQFDSKESARLFELLVGRKPIGNIVATVDNRKLPFKLILKDELDETSFEVPLVTPNTATFRQSIVLFKVAYQKSENEAVATSVSPTGSSSLTTIKSKTGQVYNVQVNLNVNSLGWPVTIMIQEPGSVIMKSLFSSDLWLTAGLPRRYSRSVSAPSH